MDNINLMIVRFYSKYIIFSKLTAYTSVTHKDKKIKRKNESYSIDFQIFIYFAVCEVFLDSSRENIVKQISLCYYLMNDRMAFKIIICCSFLLMLALLSPSCEP
jgi:hypothetical protein